jgi:hypothetical protein
MSTSVLGAARFFDLRKLHQLNAGLARIIKIELPFAVAANSWFFGE